VVLANANKRAGLRVHGWPGIHLFGSVQFSRALPPLPELVTLANRKFCTGEYYICNFLNSWFTQGFEPMMGIEPGIALLLAFANTTKPLRCCNGLVVLANLAITAF
jgi:hypothetical protein